MNYIEPISEIVTQVSLTPAGRSMTMFWAFLVYKLFMVFLLYFFSKILFTFHFVGPAVAPSGFFIGTLTKGRSIGSGKTRFSGIVRQKHKYKYKYNGIGEYRSFYNSFIKGPINPKNIR